MKKSGEIIIVVKSLLPNKENGYLGLMTLVRQGYKIHNQFSQNCYWLVIGIPVQRF